MAKLRINEEADLLISGQSPHPLLSFQRANRHALQLLGVLILSDAQLLEDPFGCYQRFTQFLAEALHRHPAPVPNPGDLQSLDDDYQIHRRAQRFIYSTIIETLQVGASMHYARQVRFGSGMHLLSIIRSDNRQVTTRSLMALFSTLISLRMKNAETFEQFNRRIDLLIQRLANWRPPVILPQQLLLFCALRALPNVPYGPVRHIILASPNITYTGGMGMLRDVADTGAKVIQQTLGSRDSGAKSSSVLCASSCKPPPNAARARNTPAGRKSTVKKPRGPSKLCRSEGPCKHHGPHAFHATSECRDPTLSRSKRAKPRKGSTLTGMADASDPTQTEAEDGGEANTEIQEDTMYSPVFVTSISKASSKRRHKRFVPRPSYNRHLQRGRHQLRSDQKKYSVRNISPHVMNECIRTYTRPIRGTRVEPSVPVGKRWDRIHNPPRTRGRGRTRKHRRAIRTRRNRTDRYATGKPLAPPQRQPRGTENEKGIFHRRRKKKCCYPKHENREETNSIMLPITISLLVSCANCGTSAKLPWTESLTGEYIKHNHTAKEDMEPDELPAGINKEKNRTSTSSVPSPPHVADKASSTILPAYMNIPSTATSREISLTERDFQEYSEFAKLTGVIPPPFIPTWDYDANKRDHTNMKRWLQLQRRKRWERLQRQNAADNEYYTTSDGAHLYTDEDCMDCIRVGDMRRFAARSRQQDTPRNNIRGPSYRSQQEKIDLSMGSFPHSTLAATSNRCLRTTSSSSRQFSKPLLSRSGPSARQPARKPDHTDKLYASRGNRDTSTVSSNVNHYTPTSKLGGSAALDAYCSNLADLSTPCTSATVEDLRDIAYRASQTPRSPNESRLDSHLRIGTVLAAEAQLEEIAHYYDDHSPQFSHCLIGEIKGKPLASKSKTESSDSNNSTSDETESTMVRPTPEAAASHANNTTLRRGDIQSFVHRTRR